MRPALAALPFSLALTLALALGSPVAPLAAHPPAEAGAHARGDQPRCLKSAKKVATKKLRIGRQYAGRLVITVSTRPQGSYSHVVCGYTEVAKRFRSRQHVVRQTFLHNASDGGRLGEIRGDTYASKRKPLIFGSSFVPEGESYVFRATLEAGRKASGKVRYRVPG